MQGQLGVESEGRAGPTQPGPPGPAGGGMSAVAWPSFVLPSKSKSMPMGNQVGEVFTGFQALFLSPLEMCLHLILLST